MQKAENEPISHEESLCHITQKKEKREKKKRSKVVSSSSSERANNALH
jgi:hypothetical protein